jgi:uncharacterized membrane-anchored protein YhcB (DUF1043 family)
MMEFTISIGAIIVLIIGFFLRRFFADLDKTNKDMDALKERLQENKTKILLVESSMNNKFENLTEKILEVKIALTDILMELKEIRKNGFN